MFFFLSCQLAAGGVTVTHTLSAEPVIVACVWIYYPGQKKRTIFEIRGEKNAVPRVISCSITRDQRRAKVADSRGSDLALR